MYLFSSVGGRYGSSSGMGWKKPPSPASCPVSYRGGKIQKLKVGNPVLWEELMGLKGLEC